MNLVIIMGLVIAWGASVGGAFFYGQGVGHDSEIAGQVKLNQAITDTREAAQAGAADAIAKLKPVNRTIVQKVEREVVENVRYRDCKLTDNGLHLANQALTGKPPEPASGK